MNKSIRRMIWLLVGCVFLMLLGVLARVDLAGTQTNIMGLNALWLISDDKSWFPGDAVTHLDSTGVKCPQIWFQAMISRQAGISDLRRLLRQALDCDSRYILLVRAVAPEDLELAEAAVGFHPDNLSALSWYGDLLIKNDAHREVVPVLWRILQAAPLDEQAWLMLGNALSKLPNDEAAEFASTFDLQGWVSSREPGYVEALFTLARVTGMTSISQGEALYRQGLSLKPHDGVRWRELGDLLRESDPQAAIQAYLACCENGDPGSHGCLRAGLTAEAIGDLDNAILYLRRSQFSGALEKADEIEARMRQELP